MNRQFLLATDPDVALNVGVGGVPTPGQTRVTLTPSLVTFNVGTNDLFVFRNGVLQTITSQYLEEDATHIVFLFLLDAVLPFVDELEFRTAQQGSSQFIEPPNVLSQAAPPSRPDNFGGLFNYV